MNMNNNNNNVVTNNSSNSNDFEISLDESDIFAGFDVESSIPTRLVHFNSPQKQNRMPIGYQPTAFDVCCGRGKQHWKHAGNINFRKFIQNNIHLYQEAQTKSEKTALVMSLVEHVRTNGGHFLKFEEEACVNDNKQGCNTAGCWVDIGDMQAREKVSHSLRDQINHRARQQAKRARKLQHHVQLQEHLQQQQQQQQQQQLQNHHPSSIAGLLQFPPSGLTNISVHHPGAFPILTEALDLSETIMTWRHQRTLAPAPITATVTATTTATAASSAKLAHTMTKKYGDDQEAYRLGGDELSLLDDTGREVEVNRHSPNFVPTNESIPVSIFDI